MVSCESRAVGHRHARHQDGNQKGNEQRPPWAPARLPSGEGDQPHAMSTSRDRLRFPILQACVTDPTIRPSRIDTTRSALGGIAGFVRHKDHRVPIDAGSEASNSITLLPVRVSSAPVGIRFGQHQRAGTDEWRGRSR